MNWAGILFFSGLSFLLAVFLALFAYFFPSMESPLSQTIYQELPHVNCGACGYPGCENFAQALSKGVVDPSKCRVASTEQKEKIRQILVEKKDF
jgi:electron transport complex protein RnfB